MNLAGFDLHLTRPNHQLWDAFRFRFSAALASWEAGEFLSPLGAKSSHVSDSSASIDSLIFHSPLSSLLSPPKLLKPH